MNTKAQKIYITQCFIVRSLIAVVAILMFFYLYFVNSAAFNAAAQERLADKISETRSTLGALELDFIEKNRDIKKEMAEDFNLALAENTEVVFVKRDLAAKLSFNE